MQPGAGARGFPRGPQSRQLDPDQDNQCYDDQPVAQQEDCDDVRGRQDRCEAGEYEESRDRKDKGRPDGDEAEPAGGTAVVEWRRPPSA